MKSISIIRRPLSPVLLVVGVLLFTTLHATSSLDVQDDEEELLDAYGDDDFNELDWEKLEVYSSGSGDFEEPEHLVSEALEYLMLYHEKAVWIEKRYKDLGENEVHAEGLGKTNQEGRDLVDKLEKLCDRLETLMVDAKIGKLSSDKYKTELIDVDREKKRLDIIFDVFSDNVTAIKQPWFDFADEWNSLQEDFLLYIEFGGEELSQLVEIVSNASIHLIASGEDDGIKGFAGGREIEFDVTAMKELKGKYEKLEKLEDRETTDPKEFMKFVKEVEQYHESVITPFLKANREQLGRFLPSLGAATVRIKINNMIAENLRKVWERNQEAAKQIIMEIAGAEERYRKIVLETAVLLKSVLKDEL